jgi:hypothetical protein
MAKQNNATCNLIVIIFKLTHWPALRLEAELCSHFAGKEAASSGRDLFQKCVFEDEEFNIRKGLILNNCANATTATSCHSNLANSSRE